jgi:hypothetical protein
MAAADLVQEFLSILLKKGQAKPAVQGGKLNVGAGKVEQGVAGHDEL